MKVLKFTLILPVACFLLTINMVSCKQGPPAHKYDGPDTVAYTYKDFKVRDNACGDNPDTDCTVVRINYPDFNGTRKLLSDSITHKFIQVFDKNPAKKDSTQQQLATGFINTYTSFKRAQPHSAIYYLLDAHAKVLMQDRVMMILEVSGYTYKGGPHGVDYIGYINWNLIKNKPITLDNILDSGYRKPLTLIAQQIFRQNQKLSDTSSLNNGHTYFFKDGKFNLPDNYELTNYGIKFLYNVNTIKPYAAGKTYLLIPYDNIRPLIRPHFGFTKNG